MKNKLTIKELLSAGVHFGHHARYWNPKMAQYIYTTRDKVHIIDLDKTLVNFQEAINFVSGIIARRGKILFVGTKIQIRDLVRREAERCGMPYVDFRWLGGMLTNYKTIRQSLKTLKELEEMRDSDLFNKMTKKETLVLQREISRLEKSLGGIRNMVGVPDAIFVLDVGYEKIAVSEANKLKVPVIGIVDTNNSPDGVDYLIPGNDDSRRAMELYLKKITDAILDAQALLPQNEEEEKEEKNVKKLVPTGKKRVFKKERNAEKIVKVTKVAENQATTNESTQPELTKKQPKTEENNESETVKSTKKSKVVKKAASSVQVEKNNQLTGDLNKLKRGER